MGYTYRVEDSVLVIWKFSPNDLYNTSLLLRISVFFSVEIDRLLLKYVWK